MIPSLVLVVLSQMPVPVTVDDLVKNPEKYHGLVRVEVTLRNVMHHDRWWYVAEAPGTRGVSVRGPASQDVNNGDRLLATGVFTYNAKLWNAHAIDVLAVEQKARPARKPTAAEEQAQAAAEKALAGTWNGVDFLEPNRFVQRLKDTSMTIEKGRMTLTVEGQVVLSGTATIDADYRILNVAVTEGAWKGKSIRGDYSLTKGVLYWSAAFPGGVRTERRLTQGPVEKE